MVNFVATHWRCFFFGRQDSIHQIVIVLLALSMDAEWLAIIEMCDMPGVRGVRKEEAFQFVAGRGLVGQDKNLENNCREMLVEQLPLPLGHVTY